MRMQREFSLPSRPRTSGRIVLGVLAGSVGLLVSNFLSSGFPSRVWAASSPETASTSAQVAPLPPRAARSEEMRKTVTVTQPDAAHRARLAEAFGRLPLSFEPNQGQTDPTVKFLSHGRGYKLFLTPKEAVLRFHAPSQPAHSPEPARGPVVLRMKLQGANGSTNMAGLEELPGKSNYLLGKDPTRWHTNIPNYRKVSTHDVYPGIDLVYYGEQQQLEYDFVVAPGADPGTILFAVEAANSQSPNPESRTPNPSDLRIDGDGDLVVQLDGGEIHFHKPVVYQVQSAVKSAVNHQSPIDNRQFIDGRFVLKGEREVAFAVGPHNKALPLVIDPVLSYSTYLGGNAPGTPGIGLDAANGIAIDSMGSAFIAGETDSTDFPTAHALQPETGGPLDFPDDAFVSKISADGQTLVYSTYLGGSRQDRAAAIAVDTFGSAYVTGTTVSPDFPHSFGAADPNCGNDGSCDSTLNINGLVTVDAFITKLNPEGSAIAYSTFFSHRGPLLVDANGDPVLDGNGNLQYLGANDQGFGIAVDNNRNAYVTGMTDVATPGFFVGPTGDIDAFLVKVDPSGANFLNITDIGGSGKDEGLAITADNSGNAYVSGFTLSSNFPVTPSAAQRVLGGNSDAFVIKLNTNAGIHAALSYSTYLGGDGNDSCCGPDPSHPGKGIALDISGKVYVTGVTNSTAPAFPTTPGAYRTSCALNPLGGCDSDAFVAKLDTTLSGAASLVYSTYLGGSGADGGAGIAADVSGNAYITGITNSTDFPIWPAAGVVFQRNYGGGNADAFVTQLNTTGTGLVYSSFLGGSNTEDGRGIAVDTHTPASAFVTGQTCSTDFPTSRPLQESSAGNCDAFVAKVLVGPDIAISPATLSFTVQSVGTTSTAQTITVTSIGDSPLTITPGTGVVISGEFAETDNCKGATLAVGETCTIDVTFSPTTPGPKSGTITITDNALGSPHSVPLSGGISGMAGDFSISADPTTNAVVAGSTASYLLTVTPAAGFNAKVNLTCTGAPSNATCSVTPSSVTLNGANPSTATISVSTVVRTLAPPTSGPSMPLPGAALRWLPWMLALLLMTSLAVSGRRRAFVVLGVVTLFVVLWSACGGGSAVGVPRGTPAGTYNLTITGASGSATHSTRVTLTVN